MMALAVFIMMSALAFAQGKDEAPGPPNDLKATTKYEGAVAVTVLTWRDGSDNELGFEILRSDNGQDFSVVGMVGANTYKYEDKVGKYVTGAFTYEVRAFNQHGKSKPSNTVSVWF